MFLLGIIGLILPYGSAKWNFIFENMIWFPVEILITIFALNKILEKNEKEKELKKKEKIVRGKDKQTMKYVRDKVTSIVYDDSIYDSKRNNKKLFANLVNDIKNKENIIINKEKLAKAKRTYRTIENQTFTFNYAGICYMQCKDVYGELDEFLNKYGYVLDSNQYVEMDKLRDLIHSLGLLNVGVNPGFYAKSYKMSMQDDTAVIQLRRAVMLTADIYNELLK
ncbi:hypothetical protein FD00_GL001526 [Liquorilactobacillus mali KCTC 3596 = DSM 20444]|uniref:Uncharacterized protein n=2 Tax=Liquorilactobacillus mali TaxID=1618 RepID=A0A0R2DYP5_9LACO|nr:hypothetical protein FD00_GL001526 [Liquorilactobacillus mali KCTC 3596 = DSM 20444]